MSEEIEKGKDKWMNAIVEIIKYTNSGISGTEPEENDIKCFLREIQKGDLKSAFLRMPLVIWMTCENGDLQEKFSNLFIEAIKDDENTEIVIDFATRSVERAIFDGMDIYGQANGAFFLECLKQMSLQFLQKER
ncbi:MAG: hypothetical protein KAI71_05410 [Candidatus Pacebacteria bacterium]|nr:hypothetical protein [Candidatus Paceibacterota bacterium]